MSDLTNLLINGDKEYTIGKFLGKGAYSKCYQVTHDNNDYAAKIIPNKNIAEKIREHIMREIKIHKKLNHSNIVRLFETFETPEKIVIIMELGKTNLNRIIKKETLSEETIKKYTTEILLGIKYLHDRYIIHRDIKPANILVGNRDISISSGEICPTLKICDFGMAIYTDDPNKNICGTPNYIAPELITKERSIQTVAIDMWSLGVTIFVMAFKNAPFETDSIANTYKKILKCEYSFPNLPERNFFIKDLIQNLLVINVYDRFTCKEALNHEFLSM